MHICVPVTEDHGLDSPLDEHFGSAACFLFADTDRQTFFTMPNAHREHAHGHCQPVAALQGHAVDVVLVASIGRGALVRLQHAGVKVYEVEAETAAQALASFSSGAVTEMDLDRACRHHDNAGGHRH